MLGKFISVPVSMHEDRGDKMAEGEKVFSRDKNLRRNVLRFPRDRRARANPFSNKIIKAPFSRNDRQDVALHTAAYACICMHDAWKKAEREGEERARNVAEVR